MSTGRVITFYSYKGGVGRTQALANIGTLLCRWGYKVLCVDWDLEAPGLDRYFQQWLGDSPRAGVMELIHAHAEGKSPRWQDHVVELRVSSAEKPLYLMPAGVQDPTYKRRLQSLDWAALYEKHSLGEFLERMRDGWKESYDFILVDSRTGITDIGGICTIQLPDQLVLLFTASYQSLDGVVDVWRSALEGRNNFPFDRARLLALPLATRFEPRVEYEQAQQWMKTFAERLEPLFADWASREVSVPELLNLAQIPYVPYWSFGERLPVLEEDGKNPEQISFAFETVAALLANGLSGTDLLVRNRDSYISAAWKIEPRESTVGLGVSARRPIRVFLSYSSKDVRLVEGFMPHLAALRQQGLIETWYDREIAPGQQWAHEVDVHIEDADIILVFLSADYLSSGYTRGRELMRALERQAQGRARMLTVLLRPGLWGAAVNLADALILPRDGRAVTEHDNVDHVWASISQELGSLAKELRSPFDSYLHTSVSVSTAAFKSLDALLSSLQETAEEAGQPPGMPFKDTALGPEDSAPLKIPKADLKDLIRACTVKLIGWGGAKFPYGWYPQARELFIPSGLRVIDTHSRLFSREDFHLWEMRFSGHFTERQNLKEDYFENSSGEILAHGKLSVEWALKDIVMPIIFTRNLIQQLKYPRSFAIKYRWAGLVDRTLTSLSRRSVGFEHEPYVSRQPEWRHECVISQGSDLYEAAYEAAESLFWQFGWDKAMSSNVPAQLRTLLEGRFPD